MIVSKTHRLETLLPESLQRSVGLLLLLVLTSLSTLSQNSEDEQSIRVIDKQTGTAIEWANVGILGKSVGGITDENGFVFLKGILDTDTLVVTDTRYTTKTLSWPTVLSRGRIIKLQRGKTLAPIVVGAVSRHSELLSETPNDVSVIQADQIDFQQPGTAADLLRESGEIFVQKTQGGGGSPVLRGFEANKVLIVVDGVRMNNAIFRSGHLQNVIALDEATLSRTEVIFGPGSALYGSDALGGVMAFSTKNPLLAWNDSLNFQGQVRARYASATGEKSGHLQLNLGKEKFGSLTAISFKDFGDIRSGSRNNPSYPDFGKRDWFVESIAQEDTLIDLMVRNEDRDLQRFTGYSQFNLMQKFRLLIGEEGTELHAGLHYSTSSNVPRYDRLTQTRPGPNLLGDTIDRPRYAQWDYGPQNWLMAYTALQLRRNNLWDNARITLAYQHFDESRISRLFTTLSQRTRDENVDVISVNADFDQSIENHRFFYGAEFVWNGVQSDAFNRHVLTGEFIRDASTRYPDGGTNTAAAALYGKYQYKFEGGLILTAAVRYSHYQLTSRFEDSTFFQFPFDQIEINTGALTGSLGAVWRNNRGLKLTTVAASGFRAPNLDDVAKVFDSSPGIVIVPNDDLGPEFVYTIEGGMEKQFGKRIRLSANAYYTWLRNAIVRSEFTFNGQDSILYDGEPSQVLANTNSGSARIAGFTLGIDGNLNRFISGRANLTWTEGVDRSIDAPLGHIPPLFGLVSLTAHSGPWQLESYAHFNGWKKLEDYSPSGVDNLEEATPEGTPAWWTLNIRGAYQAGKTFRVNLAVENVLDQHYRTFASGVSAPGRNIVIGVTALF